MGSLTYYKKLSIIKHLGLYFHYTGCQDLSNYQLHGQQLQLFDSLIKPGIKPILLYGSEVWGLDPMLSDLKLKGVNLDFGHVYNKWEAQRIVSKYYRSILGLHSRAPIMPMLGDLGRLPIYTDIIASVLKYWMSVFDKQGTLVNMAMSEAHSSQNNNSKIFNMISGVKTILHNLGIPEFWYNLGGNSPAKFRSVIKNSLEKDFIRYWYKEINNHSRFQFYSKIKSNFQLENYLIIIKDHALRTSMAKLRTSTHSLQIEKGRHVGLERDKRLCTKCNTLDSEEHFLFKCAKYNKMRAKYLDCPKLENLIDLYNNGSEVDLVKLARFINTCFKN